MARIVADRIQETSTTTGSGAYTLGGATLGFRAASVVCANGDTFTYHAEDIDNFGNLLGGWETGLGTWGTGGVLTRTTIYASTNANAAVVWASGTRRISLSLVSQASLGPTTAPTFTSTATTGTAPLTVASTTLVSNLNADLLDNQQGSYYQNASNLNSGTVPDARISGSYNGLVNLTGSGSVDFSNFLGLAADTVTTPSFTWTGDTTTGIYRPAASQIAFSIAGVQRGLFSAAGLVVTGEVSAPYIGVENSVATNGYGISLYGGASASQPTYGFMFQGTATFGTYGPVSGDWATYLTMNNAAGRGWIFKTSTGTAGNVAAISNTGAAQFASSVTATNFVSNVATGTAPLTVASTTLVSNLNANLLNGTARDTTFNSFGNGAIPIRSTQGYLYSNYFNCTADNQTVVPTRIAMETGTDGFIRWQTWAQFKSNLGASLTIDTTAENVLVAAGVTKTWDVWSAPIEIREVNRVGSFSSSSSSITGTTLTVGGTVGGTVVVGVEISGIGVTTGTTVTSFGTGTGGAGTYTVSVSQTVTTTAISATNNDKSSPSIAFHWGNRVAAAIRMNSTGDFELRGQDAGETGLQYKKLNASVIESKVATGTAPLVVASTTKVINLNADLLDGQDSTYYASIVQPQFTGPTNCAVYSKGTNGWGAFYSQGSGANWSYNFFGNVNSGELNRISSSPTGELFFGTGNGALTQFHIGNVASAVNYVRAQGSATGASVAISAQGTDANVGLNLASKGSGVVQINGSTAWHAGNDGSGSGLDADLLDGLDSTAFVTPTGTQTLTNKTIASPLITGALNESLGADITSASTIDLNSATGNMLRVTGTTTINTITLAEGAERHVRAGGAFVITYGANLILPGGVSITATSGDVFTFRGYAAGLVRCVNISYASGVVTPAGTQTLTNKTIVDTVFVVTGTTPAFTATNGGVQTWSLTAGSAPTDALTSGQSIIIVITPGAFSITWPTIIWTKQGGSGTAPTLFSAGKTMIVLWKVGTVLYGSYLGDTV